jgi:hypothetical protein
MNHRLQVFTERGKYAAFTAAAQLLDARYTDYENAIVFVPNPATNVYVVASGDVTGQELQWSENFLGNTTASYRVPTGAIGWTSLTDKPPGRNPEQVQPRRAANLWHTVRLPMGLKLSLQTTDERR